MIMKELIAKVSGFLFPMEKKGNRISKQIIYRIKKVLSVIRGEMRELHATTDIGDFDHEVLKK